MLCLQEYAKQLAKCVCCSSFPEHQLKYQQNAVHFLDNILFKATTVCIKNGGTFKQNESDLPNFPLNNPQNVRRT